MHEDHTCALKILQSTSVLWKHSNNPACTESVNPQGQCDETGHSVLE